MLIRISSYLKLVITIAINMTNHCSLIACILIFSFH